MVAKENLNINYTLIVKNRFSYTYKCNDSRKYIAYITIYNLRNYYKIKKKSETCTKKKNYNKNN